MKKIISILIIALVLGISSAAMAEKPSVTVGLKTWTASWENKFLGESIESDYGLMYGPNVNLRFGNFFGGLSYLIGGGFSFPTETSYDFVLDDYFDEEVEADRTDLDLAVGYYFHPYLSFFLGYKNTDMEIKWTDTYEFETLANDSDSFDVNLKGPAFGISGYYPIGESRWIAYGNLSYLSLSSEIDGESGDDVSGPSIEFGGAYAVRDIPLSVSIGFKYQSLKADESEDIFSGLTLGANYTF